VQQLTGQLLDWNLGRLTGVGVGLVGDGADGVIAEDDGTGRHDEPLDRIAVNVGIFVHGHLGRGGPALADQLVAGVGTRPDLDRGGSRSAHVVAELAPNP
jgi:hypothetical protein